MEPINTSLNIAARAAVFVGIVVGMVTFQSYRVVVLALTQPFVWFQSGFHPSPAVLQSLDEFHWASHLPPIFIW